VTDRCGDCSRRKAEMGHGAAVGGDKKADVRAIRRSHVRKVRKRLGLERPHVQMPPSQHGWM
jgi:hypothetical protein